MIFKHTQGTLQLYSNPSKMLQRLVCQTNRFKYTQQHRDTHRYPPTCQLFSKCMPDTESRVHPSPVGGCDVRRLASLNQATGTWHWSSTQQLSGCMAGYCWTSAYVCACCLSGLMVVHALTARHSDTVPGLVMSTLFRKLDYWSHRVNSGPVLIVYTVPIQE